MSRYAVIQAGVVVNVIEADATFAAGVNGVLAPDASIGDTYNGSTFSKPTPPAPDHALTRATKWEQVKAHRDLLTQEGGYLAAGKWFHSDTFSRTQQLGLVIAGSAVPSVQWKTMDGSFVTMTQTLAGQIFAAAAASDAALFAHAESIHASLAASSTPETVDIMAGWPVTFLG